MAHNGAVVDITFNLFTDMNAFRTGSPTLTIATMLAASLALGALQEARGAVSYLTPGSTYSQNFDSLPNTPQNASLGNTSAGAGWTDDNASPAANQLSILGWYLYHPTAAAEGGANGHQRLRIGAGTSTTGAFMSWGASGSTDRALGDLGANTLASDTPTSPDLGNLYIALRLHNDTGQTLDSFTLGFTGEQWHTGTGAAETMTFGWSTTAISVSDPSSAFNAVPALAWTAPVHTGAEGAVDGNANHVVLSPATVTGLNWAPDTDLWLRWTDPQALGPRDDGMGIDDLSFLADVAVVPEPATGTMLMFGLLALGFFRVRSNRV
jgi:hypothetical protein